MTIATATTSMAAETRAITPIRVPDRRSGDRVRPAARRAVSAQRHTEDNHSTPARPLALSALGSRHRHVTRRDTHPNPAFVWHHPSSWHALVIGWRESRSRQELCTRSRRHRAAKEFAVRFGFHGNTSGRPFLPRYQLLHPLARWSGAKLIRSPRCRASSVLGGTKESRRPSRICLIHHSA